MTKVLLEEISEWKLEAKLESSRRYFYHTRVVDRLTNGKRSYVIGRKGTGKTAVCEHISNLENDIVFTQKLSFKNFPFNVLYEQVDKGFTAPNQYITIWKYLIYTTICKMLVRNKKVDTESRIELNKVFNEDLSTAFPKAVTKWTALKFDMQILGNGVGVGADRDVFEGVDMPISDRVSFLENYIKGKLGGESYLVMFDELDEDYKNIIEAENHKKYTQLLTSLFKAVQDVRAFFKSRKVYPIVFLRDDIYSLLEDPDKNKWSDYMVELEWNKDSLKNLLAFRLSRAQNPDSSTKSFALMWGSVFEGGEVRYGDRGNKSMPIFDYITRSTQNRPRDYIQYLQLCANQALEKGKVKINPSIVKGESYAFSNYLRSEMEDEIHGAIPEIKLILNLFTKLRKQTLSIAEFKELYESEVASGNIPKRDYQFILEMLFMFSVIGNVAKQENHHIFRYQNKQSRLNMSERICVHRGLYRALQIF
ncbi:P-loop ATPase, Sll1717 family [Neptunomonas qingdaonensis]|uniref:FunZ protein n=1 Tax=Neptunomonas qingdaonensis TaxID=1045558 RepID=A0A1I2RAC5_9GAMM|nr:hypothetical protein [Neptunomonas qingdaonensis]SFG37498.1 hypothetical protein SAMN05216175_10624 [Neptunomonas qingdaonensis]